MLDDARQQAEVTDASVEIRDPLFLAFAELKRERWRCFPICLSFLDDGF